MLDLNQHFKPEKEGKMKKFIIFALLIAVLFCFAGPGYSADVKKGIHVGNAGAFTGDAAAPCMEIFNSAQIAVDEWNARGGIQGVKIKHIMGDDAMDPAQGVNVAHKFVSDDLMYGVVGPPMSHIAQATLKIYGGADLATITTAASKPELTEQGYKHFFRVNARNDAHGYNSALFMKKNLNAKRVAVLNEKVAYCENMAKETMAGLKKLGINDIMQETIVGGAKDYSAVLTKVKAYKPDVLFFIATLSRQRLRIKPSACAKPKNSGLTPSFSEQKVPGTRKILSLPPRVQPKGPMSIILLRTFMRSPQLRIM
jgi:branched-chain amino acid transport system substrate-binding protein